MVNEVIFFAVTLLDLSFVLFSLRLGKGGLIGTIVANVILVSTFGAKLVLLFGFVTNSANAFYACIFLAANMLVEHYGEKEGYKGIWVGFLGLILFIIMGQFTIRFADIQQVNGVDAAMQTLFTSVPRIAFASMFAYLIVQHFNVWLFEVLRKNSQGKHLWLRNAGGQIISQFLDSILFFSIAFFGTLPTSFLFQAILTGFSLKVIIALFSIPFIYLSYGLKVEKDSEYVN